MLAHQFMLEDGTGALQLENDSVNGDKNYFINEEVSLVCWSIYLCKIIRLTKYPNETESKDQSKVKTVLTL